MEKSYDLTRGSLSGHMVRLAAPLIVGNILQQLYNTVDALILGRFAGSSEFAAVGVAGSVMNLFLFMITGACTGISVLFARYYGARDLDSFRREHALSLRLGLAAAILLGAAGLVLMPALLRAIQTPDALIPYVQAYMTVILIGLPATFLYNLYGALLRAIGRAQAALMALAAAVTANLVLDYCFVAQLHLGIKGAAWATAGSQVISAAACFLYLLRRFPELLFHRADCRIDREMLLYTAQLSAVTSLHQSSVYIGKLLVQGAVNTGGTDMISAYTATTRIEGFVNSFGDSFASSTSVIVAQNLGSRKPERVKETFRVSLCMTIGMGLLSSLILYVSAGSTVAFMLGEAGSEAYLNARAYIRLVALFYTLCYTGNTLAGYFNGLGRVIIPFIGSTSHLALRVVLSWLLVGRMGLPAVALATGLGWILVNTLWTVIRLRLEHKPSAGTDLAS